METENLTATKKENSQNSQDVCASDLECYNNFVAFFVERFLMAVYRIEGVAEEGEHIIECCGRMQYYTHTATVSSRYHIKTTLAIGYIAWKLYRMDLIYNEWLYMGFKQDLAGHHLKRLKRYIAVMPEFADYKSLTDAESILHYEFEGKEFICEPEGIFSFNRGRHPHGMICDDILRDPVVKLDISQLIKISKAFKEQIMPMPRFELHVYGTPQDEADLFSELERMKMFNCKRYPAYVDEAKKIPLWPEVWPTEKLEQYREAMGDKAFNKEFMCRPTRSEEGYFKSEELVTVIKRRLKNYGYRRICKTDKYCYGGYDIGKKRHPSHISIYAEDRKSRLLQIASIWLDAVDYTEQLEIVKRIVKNYKLQRLHYDDTRAEMEGFKERGELPPEMEGINFTHKKKFEMAAQLEKEVRKQTIMLLSDERQKRQILNCDNDLKSMQTQEGHGDAFWSNALAISAARAAMPNIR